MFPFLQSIMMSWYLEIAFQISEHQSGWAPPTFVWVHSSANRRSAGPLDPYYSTSRGPPPLWLSPIALFISNFYFEHFLALFLAQLLLRQLGASFLSGFLQIVFGCMRECCLFIVCTLYNLYREFLTMNGFENPCYAHLRPKKKRF